MDKEVVLVDQNDNFIGLCPKLEAHKKGVLHRAFSVFIFNSEGELLIQQRADEKYHSAGLWSNTCCSHPTQNESVIEGAKRRLIEEMGIDCTLYKVFDFIYKSDVGDGLIEHEFDHVFFGESDQTPFINKNEVQDWKYVSIDDLDELLIRTPENFTTWFKICFEKIKEHVNNQANHFTF